MSGGDARRRCASPVPRMYPRCTRVLLTQTTRNAHLQAIRGSPLPDSNRRPPPYHRATSREPGVRPGSRGHESRARGRNRQKMRDRACPPVPELVFPQCSLRIRLRVGLRRDDARARERRPQPLRRGSGGGECVVFGLVLYEHRDHPAEVLVAIASTKSQSRPSDPARAPRRCRRSSDPRPRILRPRPNWLPDCASPFSQRSRRSCGQSSRSVSSERV